MSVFVQAICRADSGAVWAALGAGHDPNGLEASGRSALCAAASRNALDIVVLLIDHGADVNRQEPAGDRPLPTAAFVGHLEMVQLLLERDADILARQTRNTRLIGLLKKYAKR